MKRISLIFITMVLAMLLTAASGVIAAQKGQQAAIDYRSAVMVVYKWHIGPMFGMAKGKIPYDQVRFRENAEGLANAARLNLLAGFPEGSLDEDSEAKPEIWQQWKKFEEKFEALRVESAKLAEVAAGNDRDAAMAQLKKTGGTCGGCHDDFREE